MRNLLVLDIDETLIHARDTQLARHADFRVAHFHVYKRPYLAAFLKACYEWYELAVWSSASDSYVEAIATEIFPDENRLHFVWGASRTTTKRTMPEDYARFGGELGDYHYQKRLAKLKQFGWPLERILIIDDSPEKCATNYGNAVYPKPYEGQEQDDELRYLAGYLHAIKDEENYRAIEKRRWRETASIWDLAPE